MKSFTSKTTQVLLIGALVLGAGVYYQGVSSQRAETARQALRSVDRARSELETARLRADEYIALLESMADSNVDRQEPFSVVSEFSPREIKNLGSLLDTLYQRDGHFFLQRFELAWRNGNPQLGLLPRVVLDLEGRKVLLFSDDIVETSSIAAINQ